MILARLRAPPAPEHVPVPQRELSRSVYRQGHDPGGHRPGFLYFLPDTRPTIDQHIKLIYMMRDHNSAMLREERLREAEEQEAAAGQMAWGDLVHVYDNDEDLAYQTQDTEYFSTADLPQQLQQQSQPAGAQVQQPYEDMCVDGQEADLSGSGPTLHPQPDLCPQQAAGAAAAVAKRKGAKGFGRLFKGLRKPKPQQRAAADCSEQPAVAQQPAPAAPTVSLGAKVKQWKKSLGTAVESGANRFCDAAKSKWNSAVTFVKSHGGARLMVA